MKPITRTHTNSKATDGTGLLIPVCFRPADRRAAARLSLSLGRAVARTTGSPVVIVDGPRDPDEAHIAPIGSAETGVSDLAEASRQLEDRTGSPVLTVIDGRRDTLSDGNVEHAIRSMLRRCPYVILNLSVGAASRLPNLLANSPYIVAFGTAAAPMVRLSCPHGTVLQFEASRGAERRLLGEQKTVEAFRGVEVYGQLLSDSPAPNPTFRGIDALARRLTGRRIGVALGAGAAGGLAHVGVLERLGELGIPIDFITGTSAGAGIATLWGLGQDPDQIARRFVQAGRRGLRPAFSLRSLLSGAALEVGMRGTVDGRGFDQMQRPLGIVAVDVHDRSTHILTSGDLPRAVLASCAIPGIYPAVHIGEHCFIDGALSQPVPVEACTTLGAERVIAVDLCSSLQPRQRRPPSMWTTLCAALGALFERVRRSSTARADIVIRPFDSDNEYGMFDYRNSDRYRDRGRAAVDALAPTLDQLFPELRQPRLAAARGPVRQLLCG